MHPRSGPPGRLESQPDLHPLHGGDGHQHGGEPTIQLAVPVYMAAQPDHQPPGDDLHFASQGVPVRPGASIRAMIAASASRSSTRTGEASAASFSGFGRRIRRRPRQDAAQRDDVAADLDAEFVQQAPGERAGSDPRGRFPGAGPLEDVPGVLPVVLEHPDQVGVPRTGPADLPPALVAGRGLRPPSRPASWPSRGSGSASPPGSPGSPRRARPASHSIRSCSIFIRAPRPYPCIRRPRSRSTQAASTGRPAGSPSTMRHQRLAVRLACGEKAQPHAWNPSVWRFAGPWHHSGARAAGPGCGPGSRGTWHLSFRRPSPVCPSAENRRARRPAPGSP